MFLVVWMTRDEQRDEQRDYYVACETLAEAQARYATLIEDDDVSSASIAAVVQRIDYGAVP